MSKRQEKKSESIEVRLPYSQKQAFMDACKDEGLTASEALRAEISTFLLSRARRSQRNASVKETWNMIKQNRKKTAGTLTALAAGAALFAAVPSSAEDALFRAYDKNGDGVLTSGEISKNDSKVFEVLDKNGDGKISPDEFQRDAEVTGVTDNIINDPERGDVRVLTVTMTSISLKEESKAQIRVHEWSQDVDLDATDEEIATMVEDMKVNVGDLESIEQQEIARVMEARAHARQDAMDARAHAMEDREAAIERRESEIRSHGSDEGEHIQRLVIMGRDGEGLEFEGHEEIERLLEKHGINLGDGETEVIIKKRAVHTTSDETETPD